MDNRSFIDPSFSGNNYNGGRYPYRGRNRNYNYNYNNYYGGNRNRNYTYARTNRYNGRINYTPSEKVAYWRKKYFHLRNIYMHFAQRTGKQYYQYSSFGRTAQNNPNPAPNMPRQNGMSVQQGNVPQRNFGQTNGFGNPRNTYIGNRKAFERNYHAKHQVSPMADHDAELYLKFAYPFVDPNNRRCVAVLMNQRRDINPHSKFAGKSATWSVNPKNGRPNKYQIVDLSFVNKILSLSKNKRPITNDEFDHQLSNQGKNAPLIGSVKSALRAPTAFRAHIANDTSTPQGRFVEGDTIQKSQSGKPFDYKKEQHLNKVSYNRYRNRISENTTTYQNAPSKSNSKQVSPFDKSNDGGNSSNNNSKDNQQDNHPEAGDDPYGGLPF